MNLVEAAARISSDERSEIAADIHAAIRARLVEENGGEPGLEEIAIVAAVVMGDACGLLAASGRACVIPSLNNLITETARQTASAVARATCEGQA